MALAAQPAAVEQAQSTQRSNAPTNPIEGASHLTKTRGRGLPGRSLRMDGYDVRSDNDG